jgi:hypothetical protein
MCSLHRNEYRNFKLAGVTMGKGLGRSEEDGRGVSIGAIIHICKKTTQGNPMYSYLYLKLAKMSYFSFYVSCLFFYKIRERRAEEVLPRVDRGGGGRG